MDKSQILIYGMSVVVVGNIIVEVAKPGVLPLDNPNYQVTLVPISGTNNGSTVGVVGNWPHTEIHSTTKLNKNGSSHFVELDFKKDNLRA